MTKLQRKIWLALYVLEHRIVTFDRYHEATGASMRSYRRDLVDLRGAGMRLDGNDKGWTLFGVPRSGTKFFGWEDWTPSALRSIVV